MGLLKGLIAILVIKILFFKVDIRHVNAISFNDISFKLDQLNRRLRERDDATKIFNNSNCSELISRNISMLVPNIETYRSSEENSFYQIKSRIRYKLKLHTIQMCCKDYVQSGTKCVPRCPQSCVKGTCKEPNVCTCYEGFMKDPISGSCLPECKKGCFKGDCVEPEVCICYEGYWMDSDGYTCRPICSEECERNNGYCYEPNVCRCRLGYKQISNDSCEPVCDPTCRNGHCVAPNVCRCADGYELDVNLPNVCKPKCDEQCIFGKCTAPNTCACNEGYKAVNATVCESICENGCVNGRCIKPGLCSCDEGFVYDKTSQMCKPDCLKPCGPNGECTSHNHCTCAEGYRSITHEFEYFPALTIIDTNAPDCQPICDFPCINGKCTAPNYCTCNPNYFPWWHDVMVFQQHNNNTYNNNVCVELYKRILCDPLWCGDNKTCNERYGICVCKEGYVEDTDDVCVPFCAQGCPHRTCIAPNRCGCEDGFTLRNDSFCEPFCERGCENGDCVGPNHCVCHDNYLPNIDRHSRPECVPTCTRNCSGHGECVNDGDIYSYKCECHFGWAGPDCDQPTMCIVLIANNPDDVNRITIYNSTSNTNNTIVRIYEDTPFCYQCDNETSLSFNKETLCYTVHMPFDESNVTNVACLVNTDDVVCHTTSRYTSINVTIVWPLMILAILLIIGLTVVAYLIYRKRQKKKLATGNTSTNIFIRESFAEFMLLDI